MNQLNNITPLSWFKTGWFYLWLLIFVFLWVESKNDQFMGLEQNNLDLISDVYQNIQPNITKVNLTSPENSQITSVFIQKPVLDKKTLFHMLNIEYFLKSISVWLFEILFSLITVWLVFLTLSKKIAIRLLTVGVMILSSIILQWLLLKFSIWFSVIFVNLMLLVSVLITYRFEKELAIFLKQNNKINHLLELSVLNLYQDLSFEPVLPMIEQSHKPSSALLNQVQEVAILAEGDKNNQLAKRLHGWIIGHQSHNSISLERLKNITESEKENSNEDEMESTLVINRDGENSIETVANRSELLNIENFGRYETQGVLGKGAMGIVFQGVDPKINRHVAIKTILLNDAFVNSSADQTENQATIDRFFREAETAGNLSHANIVTIYDVGEQILETATGNQTLGYIAMDLLEGSALNEYANKKNLLAPHLVFQLMIQMADALEYAHQNNVVHRDIKPANIIFNESLKKATLTDFGIAYIADHSKTKTGTIMGSPYYMSPEQVIGSKVDGRSDIFSLGVTFYQLLTGELPFQGESIASVAFHITNTKQTSVRSHISKLPTSAARITNKALQKNVEKRYQNMNEFKQALINALKKDYKKDP